MIKTHQTTVGIVTCAGNISGPEQGTSLKQRTLLGEEGCFKNGEGKRN